MAYYPRVFYYPEDEGGGDPTRQAAMETGGTSPEEVEALAKAYEDRAKALLEIEAARNAGNEELVAHLEIQLQLSRELSDVSDDQLDTMRETINTNEANAKFESLRVDIANKLVSAFKEQFVALDKQRKALGEATGLYGSLNQELTDSVAGAARFGKGAEEVGKTMVSLAGAMTNFTQLSSANRDTLIQGSLALEQFGVSAETSAKANDFLMNSLGKSAEEAVGFQKGLIELGAEIGVSGKQLVSEFGANAKTLAKFGDKAGDVFMNLAKTAKETGVEMNELFKMTAQFDTFEGAASAVGKLNSQMGTNLDAMSLLQEEDPEKQVHMLRDAFLATGKSIENMSKFEKMAAAEAMNMDVDVLQKFLGPKEEISETDKNFKDLTEKTMTFVDKLSAVGKQLATMFTPIISFAIDLMGLLSPIIGFFADMIQVISENKILVAGLGVTMALAFGPVLWTALSGAATAAWALATPFIAAAAAALAVPLAIGAVVAGILWLLDEVFGLGAVWDAIVSGMTWVWDNLVDILLYSNPFGWMILAGMALYDNFDFIVSSIGSMFEGLWSLIKSIAEGLWTVFTAPFNLIATVFNATLGQLSFTIPDWVPFVGGQEWGIPKIPLLAEGTDNFKGGQAIVGEKGPEMVNLPKGAEVIPNDKLQSAEKSASTAKAAGEEKPPIIKLILNERELGEAVLDVINKKLDVFSAFS
jgi:hypothetical protein